MSVIIILARKRLNKISDHLFNIGGQVEDNRGGSRQSVSQKETSHSVITFIQKFKAIPSHYGRAKSSRQYLSSELSIQKMWEMWKNEREEEERPTCCYETFRTIFLTRFNLAFGHPSTDVCSTCNQFDNIIEAGGEGSEQAFHEKKLHELEAKCFYDKLKESGRCCDELCVAFDLQQNMPLPKSNIGEAYYKRQLWLYNLGIVIHKTKSEKSDKPQSPKNVFLYTWLEYEGGRGSNEIVSALMDFLAKIEKRVKLRKITKLKLHCDSCPGQNKNSTLLAALLVYANSPTCPFQSISVTFPVVGHSYLPADRVFGRIEQELRKRGEIIMSDGYYDILENFGRLRRYNHDWLRYDYKSLADSLVNTSKCGIRDSRRWFFRKNSQQVQMSNDYSSALQSYNVLKIAVKSLGNRKPKLLLPETHVTVAKKKDVLDLLELVKASPEEKRKYRELLEKTSSKPIIDIEKPALRKTEENKKPAVVLPVQKMKKKASPEEKRKYRKLLEKTSSKPIIDTEKPALRKTKENKKPAVVLPAQKMKKKKK